MAGHIMAKTLVLLSAALASTMADDQEKMDNGDLDKWGPGSAMWLVDDTKLLIEEAGSWPQMCCSTLANRGDLDEVRSELLCKKRLKRLFPSSSVIGFCRMLLLSKPATTG
jgi:hypothetical protein